MHICDKNISCGSKKLRKAYLVMMYYIEIANQGDKINFDWDSLKVLWTRPKQIKA